MHLKNRAFISIDKQGTVTKFIIFLDFREVDITFILQLKHSISKLTLHFPKILNNRNYKIKKHRASATQQKYALSLSLFFYGFHSLDYLFLTHI